MGLCLHGETRMICGTTHSQHRLLSRSTLPSLICCVISRLERCQGLSAYCDRAGCADRSQSNVVRSEQKNITLASRQLTTANQTISEDHAKLLPQEPPVHLRRRTHAPKMGICAPESFSQKAGTLLWQISMLNRHKIAKTENRPWLCSVTQSLDENSGNVQGTGSEELPDVVTRPPTGSAVMDIGERS
jgi:hypothetical protein